MSFAIEIMNTNFELEGIISDYESFICTQNYSSYGIFEMTISADKKNVDTLLIGNYIIFNKNNNKVFVIEKKVIYSDSQGNKFINISGKDIKSILNRRIILTDSYDRIAETESENVMKHYVYNHIVNSIYNGTPLPERNMSEIAIANTQNRGKKTVWQSRFENLLEVIKEISVFSDLGWKVYLDRSNKKFIFDVYEGKNLSNQQTEYPYVIFSEKRGNLSEGRMTFDFSKNKNVGYILGEGELENRLVIEVEYNNNSYIGINRKEVVIDLNNISAEDLQSEGNKKLENYADVFNLEGKIRESPNMEYEKDWNIGDIVTIEFNGIYEHKRVIEVKEIYERNNIKLEINLGDKIINIFEYINNVTKKIMT